MSNNTISNLACEGVFAIHKPPSITSAQVIRDAQSYFKTSNFFRPWFEREQERKDTENHNQRQKRRSWKQRQPVQVKIGHGGTLDPMATGVLILGVGNGTKRLPEFLECTKSYETVVLFGTATDSYDAVGKIVGRKEYAHVTKEKVEQALEKFRGKIMQKPPIFSALRVQGKRLYEYAREGKEVPVEIQARPMEVEKLEMVEWMEGGTHEFSWPEEEAGTEEKTVAEKMLHLGAQSPQKIDGAQPSGSTSNPAPSEPLSEESGGAETAHEKPAQHQPCPAPACRIRMTVTSGFYVRSLCHDLGMAVGSLGLMSSLVRSRQGDFELGRNVLEYEDLTKGEDVWGPKIKAMLEEWQAKDDVAGATPTNKRKERSPQRHQTETPKKPRRERRNTSSPETA